MPGVFDRLDKEIKDKQKEGGISPLDLAGLPPSLRKIMRLMLRELQLSYPRLCEVMDGMPEAERLSRSDLDEALSSLTQQFWLIRIVERQCLCPALQFHRRSHENRARGGDRRQPGDWP